MKIFLASFLLLGLLSGCAHAPNGPEAAARFSRAQELIKAGRFEEARVELRQAAPLLGPHDARRAHYFERMGYIAWLEKDVPNAKNFFLLSLREAGALGLQSDAVAQTHAKLGLCLMAEGNLPEAAEAFQLGLNSGASTETRRLIESELKKLKAAAR